MSAFLSRFSSLFSHQVLERRVLLNFAALRNGLVGLGCVSLFLWQHRILDSVAAVSLIPCNAALIALVSADWIEHYGRLLALGYAFNPNVSARGELEGWNGPTRREHEAEWRRWLFIPVWPDDPGSDIPGAPARYPDPIPTFSGRVRALFGGV